MNIKIIEIFSLIKDVIANADKFAKFKEIIGDIKELISDINDVIKTIKG